MIGVALLVEQKGIVFLSPTLGLRELGEGQGQHVDGDIIGCGVLVWAVAYAFTAEGV